MAGGTSGSNGVQPFVAGPPREGGTTLFDAFTYDHVSDTEIKMEPGDALPRSHLLVIGVGNEFRGDDGLGPLVAREMKRRSIPGVEIVEESGEGTSLMQAWEGARRVLIVDAVSSGQIPGTLHTFDVATVSLPRKFFHSSSHTFGLAEAIELARELHTLPEAMLVYGIEGEVFEAGVGLSERVVKSVPELLRIMEQHLKTRRW